MKCIIIEDEPQAVNTLKYMLRDYFPEVNVIKEFDKVSEAVNFIGENPVNFIFLDVQLNGELGLDIVKYLKKDELNFDIIFTTAYSEYAIEAFSLAAIDYLLKPINPERFKEAVKRVFQKQKIEFEQVKVLNELSQNQNYEKLILKNNDGTHLIDTKEIIYLKASNSYTEFYLTNQKIVVVSKSIKEYELLLNLKIFFKTHRSFIINTSFISSYHKGNLTIMLKDGTEISLSRDRKKEFEEIYL
jgi:two-component system LytT family response regulator